jgi:GNAT superfamily N-acetyltransferase
MSHLLEKLADESLACACELNMREWYVRQIQAAHGELYHADGLTWGYANQLIPPGYVNVIPFPEFQRDDVDSQIEKVVEFYRKQNAEAWCVLGRQTTTEYARERLKSWGFDYFFPSIGMGCDLSDLNENFQTPPDLKIELLDDISAFDKVQHPYIGHLEHEEHRNQIKMVMAMPTLFPNEVFNFVARLNGQIVGFTMLNLAQEAAGIYYVGVLADFHHKKIASALVAAACRFARDRGYKMAILHTRTALIPLYGGVGFRPITMIENWVYSRQAIEGTLPTREEREAARKTIFYEDFLSALLTDQPEKALDTLRQNPSLVNARFGSWGGATSLHIAAWHGHSKVVRTLIDLGAAIEALEEGFGCTPLFWAVHGYGATVRKDQLKAAEMLIRAGAGVNTSNKWNESALEIAGRYDDGLMTNLLRQHRAKDH